MSGEKLGEIVGYILIGIVVLFLLWVFFMVGWFFVLLVVMYWPVFLVMGIILLVLAMFSR